MAAPPSPPAGGNDDSTTGGATSAPTDPTPLTLLFNLEERQDRLLRELDDLNLRILEALAEATGETPPVAGERLAA